MHLIEPEAMMNTKNPTITTTLSTALTPHVATNRKLLRTSVKAGDRWGDASNVSCARPDLTVVEYVVYCAPT